MALTFKIEFWDDETLKGRYSGPLTDRLSVMSDDGVPLIWKRLPINGEDHFLMGFDYAPVLQTVERWRENANTP